MQDACKVCMDFERIMFHGHLDHFQRSRTTHTTGFWKCLGTAFGHFHGHKSWLVCEVDLRRPPTSLQTEGMGRACNGYQRISQGWRFLGEVNESVKCYILCKIARILYLLITSPSSSSCLSRFSVYDANFNADNA